MEENKKIEFEMSKLVIDTYNKIAIWSNSNNDEDTDRQKSDALKIVSQDIVQNILEELLNNFNVKTGTDVSRAGVNVGDLQSIKNKDSFENVDEDAIFKKLFDKNEIK